MNGYSKLVDSHRRLCVLQLLRDEADYRLNATLLLSLVNNHGFATGHDKLENELLWLQEQGLVSLSKVGSITLATIVARGLEVANGFVTISGVERPNPMVL